MGKFDSSNNFSHRFGFLQQSQHILFIATESEAYAGQENLVPSPKAFEETETIVSNEEAKLSETVNLLISEKQINSYNNNNSEIVVSYSDIYKENKEQIPELEKKPQLTRSKSKMSDVVSTVIKNIKFKKESLDGWTV